MRPLTAHKVTAIAFSLFLCSLAAEAAQDRGNRTEPVQPFSIAEDPGKWRRDPFSEGLKNGTGPADKGITLKKGAGLPNQEQGQDIQLQGIMKADRKFHALINGRCFKAGDRVGNATVKEISRYQVVLLNERNEKIIYDIYQGRIDRGKK